MSHIWQNPTFLRVVTIPAFGNMRAYTNEIPQSDAVIDSAIAALFTGDPARPHVLPGLNDLIAAGGPLRRGAPGLKAFILTPRSYPGNDPGALVSPGAVRKIHNVLARRLGLQATLISYKSVSYIPEV